MYGGYLQKTKIEQKSKPLRASRFVRFFRIIFGLFIFTGMFFLVAYSPLFFVHTVTVTLAHQNEENFSSSDITEIFTNTLSDRLYGFLPQKNILLFKGESMKLKLYEAYPAIKKTTIERKVLHELAVTVESRTPAYVYCRTWEPVDCSILDSTGFAFKKIYDAHDIYGIKILFEQPSHALYFKNHLLPIEYFEKLHTTLKGFEEARFLPEELILKKENFVEVKTHVGTTSSRTTTISFSLNDSPEGILGNLNTLLAGDPLVDILQKTPDAVEYFILYTGNKVIYKLRDEKNSEDM